MGGRFVQYSDPESYASHFDAATRFDATPHYNLAPTQTVLAVRKAEEDARARAAALGSRSLLVKGARQPPQHD
jgi:putative SOS response-associated peptidase YedK